MARGGVVRLDPIRELFIWFPLFLPLLFYFLWNEDLPWTLKDEAIWKRTHRLSGSLLLSSSLFSLLLCFLLPPFWDAILLFGTIGLGLIFPAILSYSWSKKHSTPQS
ncbi:MAG: hypothetical protein GC180_08045 [Bacteroidetes bacterium]|nr:hypothetical protein [Bacteroidota bacterium]